MRDSRIDGPMPATTEPVGCYRCLVPYVRKPLHLTILSERITAVLTHWLTEAERPPKGRLVRCDQSRCEWCRGGRPKRWAGFLMCWDHVQGGYAVVKFSFDGAGILLGMFPPPKPLRGQHVEMERLGESNKNPIWWKHGTRRQLATLPDCPDIMPTLMRLYGPDIVMDLARAREEQEGMS